ncbi:alpha-1,2-fucosyltransferase [Tichowtungia aerotolerans]|uniref:Alpha-1,2-fucosyltransferase n=1 Tax=Tichowtungia aerotolerans TaxID=2697043 RepID=A0A6P1M2N1_9BACT|nr:alpha-1,2-fucosyltransferase [Tichowtungia aerotolerans]QHI68087.1 hypothetical protein GT409_01005 [Tichowtungia aerotolerans]
MHHALLIAKKQIGKLRLRLSKETTPTAIIMVDGGFCSVLLKYLIGRYIECTYGIQVLYDLTWFQKNGLDCDGKFTRKFQLTQVLPDLKFPIATEQKIHFFKRFFYKRNAAPFVFNENLGEPHAYWDGYFANWKYFEAIKDTALKELDVEKIQLNTVNRRALDQIKSKKISVAVHVRRGDFINSGLCILTADYYLAAIQHIRERFAPCDIHLFVFSNGMEWTKEHILERMPQAVSYTTVEINDNDHGYFDLRLIAECDHQISSNSSFGYWGGLLNKNPDKIVIVPDKWMPDTYTSGNKKALINSEHAHRVPGWTVFSTETYNPLGG